MDIMDTKEWIALLHYAMAMRPLMRAYNQATGRPAPVPSQDYPPDLLTNPPPGEMADYLYWVTISKWGRNGVPQRFFDKATRAWPSLQLPRPLLEDER